MTQQEFDELPGLLSPSQFMVVTGLTRHKLRAEREIGLIQAWQGNPQVGRVKTYRKYYKRDAARIAGYVMR